MRYYNKWAGNPKGVKEAPSRCIAEVSNDGRNVLFHQCLRKRGHGVNGLFCKQHSKLSMDSLYVPEDEGASQ